MDGSRNRKGSGKGHGRKRERKGKMSRRNGGEGGRGNFLRNTGIMFSFLKRTLTYVHKYLLYL